MFFVTLGGFLASLFLAFVLTWFVRNQAVKRGWVAMPHSDRHIHDRPIPRIGGVAIYAAIVVALACVLTYVHQVPTAQHFRLRTAFYLLVPGTIVFLLGLYDDLRGVGPYVKFGVQAIAAVLVFAGGLRIVQLPILFGWSPLSTFASLALTVLWVLWITNAFNLIDGVDGLAAGSALFSTVVVLIVSVLNGNEFALLLTALLSGALIGFLRFNFNPATIFLGDSGSLFVGFMLGSLALFGQKSPTMVAVAIPVVSFGLPILETLISVIRRFMSGKPLFQADRAHFHHQLLKRGLTPRQTTLVLYAVSALFAMLSLFLLLPGGSPVALVLAVVGGIVWMGIQHLGYDEVVELRRLAQRTIGQKQVIYNNLGIRRAITELEACTTFEAVRSTLIRAFSDNDFDAFTLRYVASAGGYQPPFELAWSKTGTSVCSMAWRLELPLGVPESGTFAVSRYYSKDALMIDINILTRVFPEALKLALDRAAQDAEAGRLARATSAAAGEISAPMHAPGRSVAGTT